MKRTTLLLTKHQALLLLKNPGKLGIKAKGADLDKILGLPPKGNNEK
jgi:hypothetical protein